MLGDIFYIILNMSLASCFIIASLLLLRLFRPLSRRFIYPLWALAILRLTVPFAPTSRWSLFGFTGNLVKRLVAAETVIYGTEAVPDTGMLSLMNTIGAAESYSPVVYKTEAWKRFFITGSAIWAITTGVLLLAFCLIYLLTRRELNKAVNIRDNIYYSDLISSPVLVGVLRPRIILPLEFDPDSAEGRMILEHENVHRRRLDNLWRALAVGAACVHWFNPFVWVMLRMFIKDMELSCDEAVLRGERYSSDECRDYAAALLRFAEGKRFLGTSAFGRSGIRARIMNVQNYKKMTAIGTAASAAFLLVIVLMLATNPSLRG